LRTASCTDHALDKSVSLWLAVVYQANALNRYGIGLRRPHFDTIFREAIPEIDFLEVVPENFMEFGGKPLNVLLRAREQWPIVLHGVSLSIGGPDPLNKTYLSQLGKLVERIEPPWFSDHISYSQAFGIDYHDLIPLVFSDAMVCHVVDRIDQVQSRFKIPFALENPSYYVAFKESSLNEAEFINEIIHRSGCQLLLDVNNVYVNSKNHGYDPYAMIDQLPLHRVIQIHMAGHDAKGTFIVDTHGEAIIEDVFDLYTYALKKIGSTWTLLERDNNIPPLQELLQEFLAMRTRGEDAFERTIRTLAGNP